jgi:hypothetical protein
MLTDIAVWKSAGPDASPGAELDQATIRAQWLDRKKTLDVSIEKIEKQASAVRERANSYDEKFDPCIHEMKAADNSDQHEQLQQQANHLQTKRDEYVHKFETLQSRLASEKGKLQTVMLYVEQSKPTDAEELTDPKGFASGGESASEVAATAAVAVASGSLDAETSGSLGAETYEESQATNYFPETLGDYEEAPPPAKKIKITSKRKEKSFAQGQRRGGATKSYGGGVAQRFCLWLGPQCSCDCAETLAWRRCANHSIRKAQAEQHTFYSGTNVTCKVRILR